MKRTPASLQPLFVSVFALGVVTAPLVACNGESRTSYEHRSSTAQRAATTSEPVEPFIPTPKSVIARCRVVARVVHYPVPCPTRIPRGLHGTPRPPSVPAACRFAVVSLPCNPTRTNGWRGWVAGSSETADDPPQHLVITAAPYVEHNYAKLVNGPGWYSGARVRVGGWVRVGRWNARWIYVPPATNDGSAFAGHIVLVWTTAGHTYGVGFHDVNESSRLTKAMDLKLVRSIRLIAG